MERLILTEHARKRLEARRIPAVGLEMALLFGRELRGRGATLYALGRKEVERHLKAKIELRRFEGIQVVCAEDDVVVTVYRNRDFRGLRSDRSWRKGNRGGERQTRRWNRKAAETTV